MGRLAALPRDIVIGDPGPDLMFDDRVYKRGALTLHALRLVMGDADFFANASATWSSHRPSSRSASPPRAASPAKP